MKTSTKVILVFIWLLVVAITLSLLNAVIVSGKEAIEPTPTSPPEEGKPFLVEWIHTSLLFRVYAEPGSHLQDSFVYLRYEDYYGEYDLVIPVYRVDGQTFDYFYYWIAPCLPTWIFPPGPPYCTIPENVYTITEAWIYVPFTGETIPIDNAIGRTWSPVIVWMPIVIKGD